MSDDKRNLTLNGEKVRFDTPESCDSFGLKMLAGARNRIVIPVNQCLRDVLNQLEEEVVKLLPQGEIYKPLYQGQEMCVTMSNYCRFYMYDKNFTKKRLPITMPLTKFGAGSYVFELEAPHVYFGPHREGETCSINLIITAINWKPAEAGTLLKDERPLQPGMSPFKSDVASKGKRLPLHRQPGFVVPPVFDSPKKSKGKKSRAVEKMAVVEEDSGDSLDE